MLEISLGTIVILFGLNSIYSSHTLKQLMPKLSMDKFIKEWLGKFHKKGLVGQASAFLIVLCSSICAWK